MSSTDPIILDLPLNKKFRLRKLHENVFSFYF